MQLAGARADRDRAADRTSRTWIGRFPGRGRRQSRPGSRPATEPSRKGDSTLPRRATSTTAPESSCVGASELLRDFFPVEKPSSHVYSGIIAKTSDTPPIPNLEILGRIGGGSYGEVYLARTVTGMYRAVKVVRREDFEYERTFEREFEGIQRYEKVSQDHPGLVDVLHVGRDDAAGFYYYVMELADDENGEPVEARLASYKPRTLSSDLRRRAVRTVRECVDLGIAVAGALGHLHRAGLTHRDVKPSNLIFVKGQAKLADVGLVASTGQRTFVGTEGYVPPEGPGTSSADLYSLAMVLYEMHTGKDRLDFPELPTNLEIPPSVNRDEWRALNAVICRAGSPDPRKRYESAGALIRALETVCAVPWKAPQPKRSALPALFGTVAALGILGIAGFGGWWLWQDNQKFVEQHGNLLSDNDEPGGVNGAGLRVPVSAKPLDDGRTPGKGGEPAGEPATPDPGKQEPASPEKEPGEAPDAGKTGLAGTPPVKEPQKPAADAPDSPAKTPEKSSETESAKEPAKAPEPEKAAPMLVATEVADGGGGTGGTKPLTAEIVRGQVKIASQPPAATVYLDGKEIGVTETRLLDLEVGPVELVLKREGYHDHVFRGEVKEGTQVVSAILLPDLGPLPGSPWINSLGMEFRPLGDDRHQSAAEVSVAVFDRFLEETGGQIPRAGLNGIVQVSEDRAIWSFCDWLTETDRRTGHLGPGHYHRPLRSDVSGRKNSFFVTVEHAFGTLVLNSEPSGAKVFRQGALLGETPAVLENLRLGAFELELVKPGYEVASAMGDLASTEARDLVVSLERDASVVFGEAWTNSQGMELVPVGALLVARNETPSKAYLEYLAELGALLDPASANAALDYPASGVGYAEATAFCDWLTRRERDRNLIRPWQRYRLPADLEWSRFAGLSGETGATPEERNRAGGGGFPWGSQWPPPPGAGNFGDASASGILGGKVIADYTDGFETTSPVGRFAPSPNGLLDLAGNVWEWVQEPYSDGSDGLQVVRGGGWNSSEREVLATAYRNPVPAEAKDGFYGFRYVLEETGNPE